MRTLHLQITVTTEQQKKMAAPGEDTAQASADSLDLESRGNDKMQHLFEDTQYAVHKLQCNVLMQCIIFAEHPLKC